MKNKIIFYIFLFLISACTTFQTFKSKKSADAQVLRSIQQRLPTSMAADPTFEQLRVFITSHPEIKTIDQFLQAFHKAYPDYFEGYTLGYASKSLQQSSVVNPRAIVFGSEGRLIITFNGHPDQRGYDVLETMEYDREKGFLFREIKFTGDKARATSAHFSKQEIENIFDHAIITKPNPSSCTKCHGVQNTRPIWEIYAMWPGFYGSEDDNVYRMEAPSASRFYGYKKAKGPFAKDISLIDDIERKNLFEFIFGNKKKSPRYSVLGLNADKASDIYFYNNRRVVSGQEPPRIDFRPNLELTRILQNQMWDRLSSHLIAKEKFWPWRYFYTAGIICNNDYTYEGKEKFKDFLPTHLLVDFQKRFEAIRPYLQKKELQRGLRILRSMQSNLDNQLILAYGTYSEAEFAPDYRKKFEEAKLILPGLTESEFKMLAGRVSESLAILYAILKMIDIDFADWSTTALREPARGDGFYYDYKLAILLLEKLRSKFEADGLHVNLQKYKQPNPDLVEGPNLKFFEIDCDKWAEKSREALSQIAY